MKKTLKISGIVLLVLIAIVACLPFIFKGDIKKAVDNGIKENINGEVFFDANSFSVGIFRNFPNLTVSMGNFGMIGAGKFEGDTLMSVKDFSVALDIMSVISGDNIEMTSLVLDGAYINGIVLKDSTANYLDILKDTGETEEEEVDTAKTNFSFSGKWKITNSRVRYRDESSKMYAEIKGLNHEGKGDFTQDIFDLVTNTNLKGVSFSMEGTDYLSEADFSADLTLNMDMQNSKYTFKDNLLKLNDFSFGFDGWVQMKEDESIDMSVKYETKETEFKNILSLVPGVFMEGFEKMKTKGTLAFDGLVEGTYSETSMPGFKLNLQVANAMFQYPDLPSAVENIAIDLKVVSAPNEMEQMSVNLKQFHLDMGSNPVDLKSRVKMLGSFDKMDVDADANISVNLAEISKFYPIEGLDLKGNYKLTSKVNGTYDMVAEKFPSSESSMTLDNGFVKSKDFPAPIEDMSFDIFVKNTDGALSSTFIGINQFKLLLDGEPMEMKATINDLDNIKFVVDLKGSLDFDKLTKIYPLEDMTLKGKMAMNVSTQGTMEDVENEKYGAIPTEGSMTFTNFEYYDNEYLPNGFKMTDASLVFTPAKIIIERMTGYLGNSDLNVTGNLSNYINYTFGENQVLKGNMTLVSNTFDVDEWMVEEEGVSTAEDEEPLEVIELPKDIDFMMSSTIKSVKYDNYGISNLKGDVNMKDGKACFLNTSFNCIGGQFLTNGCYDPSDMSNPQFNFDIDIKNAGIADAYRTFNTIQVFAPIAQIMDGQFNTNFKMQGPLDQEMFPIMKALTGGGNISVTGARLKNAVNDMAVASPSAENDYNLLAQSDDVRIKDEVKKDASNKGKTASAQGMVNILTKIKDLTNIDLFNQEFSPTLLDAEIKEGRLHILPFDTKLGQNLMNVSGSNGVDGTLNYLMKMDVPSGKLGDAAGKKLADVLGTPVNTDRVKFDLILSGLMNNPALKMGKPSSTDMASSVIENVVQNKKDEVKDKVDNSVQEQKDKACKEAQQRADNIMATAKTNATQAKNNILTPAKKAKDNAYAEAKKLENSSTNPLKKSANKIAADKARKVADNTYKNAETKANNAYKNVMDDAQRKADAQLQNCK